MKNAKKKENLKRYLLCFFGLLLNSLGVALMTKAALGISPIAAVPYSLSLILPILSLGNWTIVFSIFLIIVQIILLKKEIERTEIIFQILISLVFGYCIDFFLIIVRGLLIETYVLRFIVLLASCAIIAIGVYMEIQAAVVMLPGDAFVKAVSKVLKRPYGGVRVISDICMALGAAVICLCFTGELSGVREGTIVAAVITGNIVKILGKFKIEC